MAYLETYQEASLWALYVVQSFKVAELIVSPKFFFYNFFF